MPYWPSSFGCTPPLAAAGAAGFGAVAAGLVSGLGFGLAGAAAGAEAAGADCCARAGRSQAVVQTMAHTATPSGTSTRRNDRCILIRRIRKRCIRPPRGNARTLTSNTDSKHLNFIQFQRDAAQLQAPGPIMPKFPNLRFSCLVQRSRRLGRPPRGLRNESCSLHAFWPGRDAASR